jgi:23S rRNA pseudouridine2605 synthase
MRINQWLARATGISRREADSAIAAGLVMVNGQPAELGQSVRTSDTIIYRNRPATLPELKYVIFHKPIGYICSRQAQGKGKTIYNLLPSHFFNLKSVGRLDKDSSGLLILTNDGELANQLTHPSYEKSKRYEITLNSELKHTDRLKIEAGVLLSDGPSRIQLMGESKRWIAVLNEGRNRQIRRTFDSLGYKVEKLHRVSFGKLELSTLPTGKYKLINKADLL